MIRGRRIFVFQCGCRERHQPGGARHTPIQPHASKRAACYLFLKGPEVPLMTNVSQTASVLRRGIHPSERGFGCPPRHAHKRVALH